MSVRVEFTDPPAAPRTQWVAVRDELARQPGVWARIGKRGGYPRQRLAELGCEVRQVTIDGTAEVYARVPSDPDASEAVTVSRLEILAELAEAFGLYPPEGLAWSESVSHVLGICPKLRTLLETLPEEPQ